MSNSIVTCGHPWRKHEAHGMCKSCYNRRYKNTKEQHRRNNARWRERHYDVVLAQERKSARKRYATAEGKSAARLWHLRSKFGISGEDYNLLLASQNGVCAICGQPETAKRNGVVKFLAVDHNHKTGKIRGLLCQKCNTMVGHSDDNAERLKDAAAYLEKHLEH